MTDEQYLQEALRMADFSEDRAIYKKVGALLVLNHSVIGRGFRRTFIINNIPYIDVCYHAEHVAIASSGYRCEGATLYCTMEPCAKRTRNQFTLNELPKSCSELIVKYGISKVLYLKKDIKSSSKEYFEKHNIETLQL